MVFLTEQAIIDCPRFTDYQKLEMILAHCYSYKFYCPYLNLYEDFKNGKRGIKDLVYMVIKNGHVKILELILTFKVSANCDIKVDHDESMKLAVESGNLDMVKYLVSKGCPIKLDKVYDFIDIAVKKRHSDIERYLLSKEIQDNLV